VVLKMKVPKDPDSELCLLVKNHQQIADFILGCF
jgi:hypothetical protein